jgi:hypothetical protein
MEFLYMLSRLSKLVLLFFSPDNPLWKEVIDSPPAITQHRIAEVVKISQSTLANWKKGGPINLPHLEAAFTTIMGQINEKRISDARKRDIRKSLDCFQSQCFDRAPRRPIYNVAQSTLAISMEECQKILDSIMYDTFTIFPSLSYESKSEADKAFNRYRGYYGAYHLYVRRHTTWLKCPLRIRYVIPNGIRHLIRCKLNAPIISSVPREPYMEYDGFMKSAGESIFWKFEKRTELDADFFDFITDTGKGHGVGDRAVRVVSGTYLTTGQDSLHNIEHSDVIMQGLAPMELAGEDYKSKSEREIAERISEWMHTTACIVDDTKPVELDTVNELWSNFGFHSRVADGENN